MDKLRILIPKGRIFDKMAELFAKAGFPISLTNQTYRFLLPAEWQAGKLIKPRVLMVTGISEGLVQFPEGVGVAKEEGEDAVFESDIGSQGKLRT